LAAGETIVLLEFDVGSFVAVELRLSGHERF
jgi:hypothetical protein